MLTEQDRGRVYNAGIRLLARREYGVTEIIQKLSQKHPRQLVEQVVAQLLEQNLVSDSRFAESLCNSRTGRGYGPIYISQELSMKGIAKDIIQERIDKNDPVWLERAIKAGRKKASALLLEKDFFQSEAFEKEFLRQKGVDADDATEGEGFEDHLLSDAEDESQWAGAGYEEAGESGDAEDGSELEELGQRLRSRKFNHSQNAPGSLKVKDLQKAKSLQKTRNMGQKRVKKVIFKKTKEQFFRERRQKDWMKVAGFLSRRGFPGDLVSKAMNSIAPD